MSRRRTLTAAVGAAVTALAVAVAPAAPAAAAPDALRTYVLPGQDVFPEGVAVLGGDFYTTSTSTGNIYRGDLRQRRAEVFVHGDLGQFSAVGIKATATRLVVAGGSTGTVSVYDRRTGALLTRFANRGGNTFINDVSIAPNGDAYLTDSFRPVLYRIPAAKLAERHSAAQRLPVFRSWVGTPFQYVAGAFNANGLAATSDGRFLVVVSSATGALFRVRLSDKQVVRVDLHGQEVHGDGLVLTEADVLYAVAAGRVVEVRLGDVYLNGRVVSSTGNPSFASPTTAALAGDRLLVVNSQFGGPGEPPFTVSSIPLP